MSTAKAKLTPLENPEAKRLGDIIGATPESAQKFIGWILNAAKHSGTIADEIRAFVAHIERRAE